MSSESERCSADLAPSVEALEDKLPREMYVYQLGVQRLYVRDAAETGVEVTSAPGRPTTGKRWLTTMARYSSMDTFGTSRKASTRASRSRTPGAAGWVGSTSAAT